MKIPSIFAEIGIMVYYRRSWKTVFFSHFTHLPLSDASILYPFAFILTIREYAYET